MKSLPRFVIAVLLVCVVFPSFGSGMGQNPTATIGPPEVLSDTMGVDFGPYLQRVMHDVTLNWYKNIPESAKAGDFLLNTVPGPASPPRTHFRNCPANFLASTWGCE